jgi:hypothetical protein
MNTSTQHEERLYDLLEQKAFEALTSEEKAFVLTYLDEQSYRLQRAMLLGTQDSKHTIPTPKPLVLPRKAGKTIPMYQAVLAVASVIVFFLFFMPKKEETIRTIYKQAPVQVSTQTIHDTIVQVKEVIREKVIYKTVNENLTQEFTQPLSIIEPMLTQQETQPQEKILSLKDDPIAQRFLSEMAMYDGR